MIDGTAYQCRIPFFSDNPDDYNEWQEVLDHTSVMNDVWHWRNGASWMFRTDTPDGIAAVGYTGPLDLPKQSPQRAKSNKIGFRPVLIPIPVEAGLDKLIHSSITVITPGEVIYGKLLNYTDYDLILEPDSILSDTKRKWAAYNDDDTITVDRAQVLHLCLRMPTKK